MHFNSYLGPREGTMQRRQEAADLIETDSTVHAPRALPPRLTYTTYIIHRHVTKQNSLYLITNCFRDALASFENSQREDCAVTTAHGLLLLAMRGSDDSDWSIHALM